MKNFKKVGVIMGKIGRPRAKIPRNRIMNIRVTDFEFVKIARVAKEKNLTKTAALLKGIDLLERDKTQMSKES